MSMVLDIGCKGEKYLIAITRSNGRVELSIHDSSDLALYSSLWSDDINSFMLSSIPRECKEMLASKLGQAKAKANDTLLEGLIEKAISTLKSL